MKPSKMSSFIAFDLLPEEELQAFTYNDLQVAGIQNLISAAAEEIVSVALEADQLSLDAQKKLAYTKGQIDILKTLLARADVVAETLAQEQEDRQQ
jgi:lipopolysaccharide export system protein LptA